MPAGGNTKEYDMNKAFSSIKELAENREKYSSELRDISDVMRKRAETKKTASIMFLKIFSSDMGFFMVLCSFFMNMIPP